MPSTYLALLRGINVGGKNLLPMKDLTALFTDAGCEDVRTYIQSGNVVFRSSPRTSAKLAGAIASQIAKSFGYRTPVVIRTVEEMGAVVANNPFLKAGTGAEGLHVMFLADVPKPDHIAALDPERGKPDAFIVLGQEVYLHLPNGMGRTKLTNDYFDSKLRTSSTARNWRTVTKLLEMMGGRPE
jgi:uncharacterized protein (DUF1697 family)